MNKIDLIIDALESAHHTNDTGVIGLTKSRLDVALAAARGLKTLKPVGEIVGEDLGKHSHARKIRMHFYDFAPSIGTKLYALENEKA